MRIAPARFPKDHATVTELFRSYQERLGVDLEYQSFEDEVAKLPGKYAAPRGNILLAWEGDEPIGCMAWHPMSDDICEIKRLFVKSGHTGKGIGKAMLQQAMEMIHASGYRTVRLDSLQRLEAAKKLYLAFGFAPTAPYNESPLPDVYYMERKLVGRR